MTRWIFWKIPAKCYFSYFFVDSGYLLSSSKKVVHSSYSLAALTEISFRLEGAWFSSSRRFLSLYLILYSPYTHMTPTIVLENFLSTNNFVSWCFTTPIVCASITILGKATLFCKIEKTRFSEKIQFFKLIYFLKFYYLTTFLIIYILFMKLKKKIV